MLCTIGKLLLLLFSAVLLVVGVLPAHAAGEAPEAEAPRAGGNHYAGEYAGESYRATIWVDPDGCEHWVLDDGWEGYMSPHLTRDGRPVCRQQNICAVMNADQLFASGRASIPEDARRRLAAFFRDAPAKSFIIAGYTDSRGGRKYNLRLSQRRAEAVAAIARAAGVRVGAVRAYGEAFPRASNDTAAGRAQNRRVEIICMY